MSFYLEVKIPKNFALLYSMHLFSKARTVTLPNDGIATLVFSDENEWCAYRKHFLRNHTLVKSGCQ